MRYVHIHTFALKFQLRGSNPETQPLRPRPLRNLQIGMGENDPRIFTDSKENDGPPDWLRVGNVFNFLTRFRQMDISFVWVCVEIGAPFAQGPQMGHAGEM